jgi:hypothetical protein
LEEDEGYKFARGRCGIQFPKGSSGIKFLTVWSGIKFARGWRGIKLSRGWRGIKFARGWRGIKLSRGWRGIKLARGWMWQRGRRCSGIKWRNGGEFYGGGGGELLVEDVKVGLLVWDLVWVRCVKDRRGGERELYEGKSGCEWVCAFSPPSCGFFLQSAPRLIGSWYWPEVRGKYRGVIPSKQGRKRETKNRRQVYFSSLDQKLGER